MLDGAATDTLAAASGAIPGLEMPETDTEHELPPSREIGNEALEPGTIEEMEEDLKSSPPLPVDLTRQLKLFVSEVQSVELRLTNALLSKKTIRQPADFLRLDDDGLRQRIESLRKIPSTSPKRRM